MLIRRIVRDQMKILHRKKENKNKTRRRTNPIARFSCSSSSGLVGPQNRRSDPSAGLFVFLEFDSTRLDLA